MAEYIERETAEKVASQYGCTNGSTLGRHKCTCVKCGEVKEICCTVGGKPWCKDCFDKAMGWKEEQDG